LNERSVGTLYDELTGFVNSFLREYIARLTPGTLTTTPAFGQNIPLDNKFGPVLPTMTERSLKFIK
jgi:hypothetical protein